ncbi:hypothetical protein BJV74DRAFT_862974, partial [Russula compacta]
MQNSQRHMAQICYPRAQASITRKRNVPAGLRPDPSRMLESYLIVLKRWGLGERYSLPDQEKLIGTLLNYLSVWVWARIFVSLHAFASPEIDQKVAIYQNQCGVKKPEELRHGERTYELGTDSKCADQRNLKRQLDRYPCIWIWISHLCRETPFQLDAPSAPRQL